MIGVPYVDKDYGPAVFVRSVDGQCIPAIPPAHLRAETDKKARSRQGGEEIAGARVLRVEFGKHRADRVRPEDDLTS
jgi:hypothetical protein